VIGSTTQARRQQRTPRAQGRRIERVGRRHVDRAMATAARCGPATNMRAWRARSSGASRSQPGAAVARARPCGLAEHAWWPTATTRQRREPGASGAHARGDRRTGRVATTAQARILKLHKNSYRSRLRLNHLYPSKPALPGF
jgi:hypothetical protein